MRVRSLLIAVPTVALTAVAMTGLTSAAVAAPASAKATGAPQQVLVILGSQHQTIPATSKNLDRRRAAVSADQSPVRTQISQLGGRTTKAYRAVNAVAATVPDYILSKHVSTQKCIYVRSLRMYK